eukprot:359927-Chlamydomonas_euryale.AAC.4
MTRGAGGPAWSNAGVKEVAGGGERTSQRRAGQHQSPQPKRPATAGGVFVLEAATFVWAKEGARASSCMGVMRRAAGSATPREAGGPRRPSPATAFAGSQRLSTSGRHRAPAAATAWQRRRRQRRPWGQMCGAVSSGCLAWPPR